MDIEPRFQTFVGKRGRENYELDSPKPRIPVRTTPGKRTVPARLTEAQQAKLLMESLPKGSITAKQAIEMTRQAIQKVAQKPSTEARFGPFLGGYEGASLDTDPMVPALVRPEKSSIKQQMHRNRFTQMIRRGDIPKKQSFYAWMKNKADPRNDLDLRKENGGFYICKLAKTILGSKLNRGRYWPIFANIVAARMGKVAYEKAGHSHIGRKDVTRALKIYDKLRSPSAETCVKIPGGKDGKASITTGMALAGAPLPKPRSREQKSKKGKKGKKGKK